MSVCIKPSNVLTSFCVKRLCSTTATLGIRGNPERFIGRNVAITGAYGGFGTEITQQIIKEGGNVIAIGKDEKKMNNLISKVNKSNITSIIGDLSSDSGQDYIIQQLKNTSVDSLVNNAGIFKEGDWNEYTKAYYEDAYVKREDYPPPFNKNDYDKIMKINLEAPLFISQAITKHWIEQKIFGNVVNISSLASLSPLLGHTLYGLSKAGLDYITKHMALELTPHNIQVNSVNATIVDSEMGTGPRGYWGNEYRKYWALSRISIGRFIKTPEIVSIVCYLLSNEARFITGQNIQVDGGLNNGAFNTKIDMILPEKHKKLNDKCKELEQQNEMLQKELTKSKKN